MEIHPGCGSRLICIPRTLPERSLSEHDHSESASSIASCSLSRWLRAAYLEAGVKLLVSQLELMSSLRSTRDYLNLVCTLFARCLGRVTLAASATVVL